MFPPDCDSATAVPARIWPPNHKLVEVDIAGVTTSDGAPAAITITRITQDEPIDAEDGHNPCPDGTGVGTDTARVRATRIRTANGRVYHIEFVARDSDGAECAGTVTTCMPVKRAASCIDDGPLFDATAAVCSPTCDPLCGLEAALSGACGAEHLPGGLQHRIERARVLVAQAAEESANKSIRDTMKALRILQTASRAAARAQTRGAVSANCAHAIADIAPGLPALPAKAP